MVGETSDSFSMLLQRVSRGSVGSRCASCSETAGLPRQRSRRIARRRLVCFSNTGTKHSQPANQPPAAAAAAAAAARPAAQIGRLGAAQRRALPAPLWRARGDAMDVTAASRDAGGVYL